MSWTLLLDLSITNNSCYLIHQFAYWVWKLTLSLRDLFSRSPMSVLCWLSSVVLLVKAFDGEVFRKSCLQWSITCSDALLYLEISVKNFKSDSFFWIQESCKSALAKQFLKNTSRNVCLNINYCGCNTLQFSFFPTAPFGNAIWIRTKSQWVHSWERWFFNELQWKLFLWFTSWQKTFF